MLFLNRRYTNVRTYVRRPTNKRLILLSSSLLSLHYTVIGCRCRRPPIHSPLSFFFFSLLSLSDRYFKQQSEHCVCVCVWREFIRVDVIRSSSSSSSSSSSWEVLLNPLIVFECVRRERAQRKKKKKKKEEEDSQERQLIDEPIVRARFSSLLFFFVVFSPICCLLSVVCCCC